MNGSTLTYSQIMSVSSNLNSYAREMQAILDEITTLSSKIGNEDVWAGNAAMESKQKFNTISAKFADFYKAVTDEAAHLTSVVENYKKTDDIKLKNFLLKSVIDEIIYFKEKDKRNAKFELDIKLKI